MNSDGVAVGAAPEHDKDGRFRIGVGAGFAGDRYEPAAALARHADLDALVFECLAERTIALAQQALRSGASEGFDRRILRRLHGALPGVLASGGTVITNAGAANPVAAAKAVSVLAGEMGLDPLPVAAVTGDDVLGLLDLERCHVQGTDRTLADYRDRIVSANAYTGAGGIVEAIEQGARVVLTGRTADASLFLAPLVVRYGWDLDTDLDAVAGGLLVGHLLECGGQLTGGYFADGTRKTVPDLAHLGFPFADVDHDGVGTYRKLPGTGGRIDRRTVLEQLLYEIDDPTRYVTPDGTLDLSSVEITETGPDTVRASGAVCAPAPRSLKVSVGIDDGFLASAGIVYAGAGCLARALLAADILHARWTEVHGRAGDALSCDVMGVNASRPWWVPERDEPPEVGLRVSVRTLDRADAVLLTEEVEALYTNGPAGGGGVTSDIRQTTGIVSTLVPRDLVTTAVEVFR